MYTKTAGQISSKGLMSKWNLVEGGVVVVVVGGNGGGVGEEDHKRV